MVEIFLVQVQKSWRRENEKREIDSAPFLPSLDLNSFSKRKK